MSILVADISLDTFRKNNIKPLVVPQYDYGKRYVDVSVYADGKPVNVENNDVFINANRRSDGQSFSFQGTVNADGSIRVPIAQQMTDNIGDVYCTISFKDQDGQASTTSFLIEVVYNPNGGTAEPEGEDVLSALEGRIDTIEDFISSIGNESYTVSAWTSLGSSSPYTHQATVTATHTIGNDTVVELINDQAVLFATYGFAIGAVSGQNITIYSIGQPSSNVTLEVSFVG